MSLEIIQAPDPLIILENLRHLPRPWHRLHKLFDGNVLPYDFLLEGEVVHGHYGFDGIAVGAVRFGIHSVHLENPLFCWEFLGSFT